MFWKEELNCSQKESAFSPEFVLGKEYGDRRNQQEINIKKLTKSYVDSCYYTILLERSVHSEAATGGVL